MKPELSILRLRDRTVYTVVNQHGSVVVSTANHRLAVCIHLELSKDPSRQWLFVDESRVKSSVRR